MDAQRLTKLYRKFSITLLASLVLGLACFALPSTLNIFGIPQVLKSIENVIYDANWKVRLTLEEPPPPLEGNVKELNYADDRIVVVDIDDNSLLDLGNYYKWPRSYHAKVIRDLLNFGAASVTFDILFADADYGTTAAHRALVGIEKLDPNLHKSIDSAALAQALNDDKELVQAASSSPRVIISATTADVSTYPDYPSKVKHLSSKERALSISPHSAIQSQWLPPAEYRSDLLDNVFDDLGRAGNRMGLVNVIPDPDGVHRSEPLFFSYPNPKLTPGVPEKLYPVIGLQTAIHLFGLQPDQVRIKAGEYVDLGKPLGLYREKSGHLGSTYPGLSGPMIEDLLRQQNAIAQLLRAKDTAENGQRIIISDPLVMHNADGQLQMDIFDGQILTQAMIQAMWNAPELQDSARLFTDTSISAEFEGLQISWMTDEHLPLLYDTNAGEESYINPKVWSVVQSLKNNVPKLVPGQRYYLSSYLEIRLDPVGHRVISNFPILSEKVLEDFVRLQPEQIHRLSAAGDTLRIGPDVRIPIDDNGRMMINYRARYQLDDGRRISFPTIPYSDIVNNRVKPGSFEGKAFILGSTAAALFDQVSSPIEKIYPGVMIHATLLSDILNQDFLTTASQSQIFIACIILALIATFTSVYFGPLGGLSSSFLLFLTFSIIQFLFFWQDRTVMTNIEPYITLGSATVSGMIIRYFFEVREKRRAVDLFKHYISPELIDMMLKSDTKPQLGGQKSHLTAYFTDIAGFSTFSEKIGDPEKLVDLLNEYLSAMTDILLQQKGTLDKYEGDAIIAFFGAPVQLENNAKAACDTAIAMQEKLAELRIYWKSQGDKWPSIVHNMRMRIGLNSGMIVTGNMGSRIRLNYTMMGDAVNLAARLESGAKQYGVFTMMSKETIETAGAGLLARKIDVIKVVGKSEPVEVYELLGHLDTSPPELQRLCALFEEAWALYAAQEWTRAIELFSQCLDLEPHHPDRAPGCHTTPSHVFKERCERFMISPPAKDWDGVYTASEK